MNSESDPGTRLLTVPTKSHQESSKALIRTHEEIPRLIELSCNVDDRGFLYQVFGNYSQVMPGIKRAYLVGNFSKGIIRGYHMHKYESKAYFVVSGSAKFVTSRDPKQLATFVLSYRKPVVLFVPPGFYHGWVSLEDNTILLGLSNRTLEESLLDDFRIEPASFGEDVWQVKNR